MPEATPNPEPENVEAPKMDAGGKVVTEDKGVNSQQKIPYEELQKQNQELVEFARGVFDYVKTNPDGTREFDIQRIIDENGYDVSSLRKKGEQPPEPKPVEPKKDPAVERKEKIDAFNKDPEAFMAEERKRILEEAKAEIKKETAPLVNKDRERQIIEMVNTVKAENEDFGDLEADVTKLASVSPVRNIHDLRNLVYAARARKQQGSNGLGLDGSNRGNPKANSREPAKSAEEIIADQIVGYAGKSETPETKAMTKLLGKSTMSPLRLKPEVK